MNKTLYRVENGKLIYSLHEGQARAWKSKARFTWVIAGTQSGKTSFGSVWLWREIQNTASPEGGTNDYLAVTASYDLFKLKMLPEIRGFFEHLLQVGRYWSGDRIIELKDPSTGKFWATRVDDPMWGRIVLRSAHAGGGLESLTGRGAWLDECGQDGFGLESYEAVQRRLAIAKGRILGTTTPYNLGWLKQQVFDKWLNGDKTHNVIQFPSYFNPIFDKEEYLRAKASMPKHRFALFYDGEFAKPPGMIYDCFDEDFHTIDDFSIPNHYPRYVGIDFGATNTALIWIAEDIEKGIYYIYRESLEGGMATKEHCDRAIELARYENVRVWLGGSPSETQQRMDWNNCGIPVVQPYVSDVEGGIDRPYGLYKTKRLFIFKSCSKLIDEIGRYKRKLDELGEPLEEIVNKNTFHLCDAKRYACSTFEGMKLTKAELPKHWK